MHGEPEAEHDRDGLRRRKEETAGVFGQIEPPATDGLADHPLDSARRDHLRKDGGRAQKGEDDPKKRQPPANDLGKVAEEVALGHRHPSPDLITLELLEAKSHAPAGILKLNGEKGQTDEDGHKEAQPKEASRLQ
jgi:hypothetical protein